MQANHVVNKRKYGDNVDIDNDGDISMRDLE